MIGTVCGVGSVERWDWLGNEEGPGSAPLPVAFSDLVKSSRPSQMHQKTVRDSHHQGGATMILHLNI
jgi:hypothetical protein